MTDGQPTARLPDTTDVAVIGGGPAGIAAAVTAAASGADVLLLDENHALGGQIWRHGPHARPAAAQRWLERLSNTSLHIACGATVVDAWRAPEAEPFELLAYRDGRASRVRARHLVLCTGARERFLPFPGWTLPGVVGIGGAQALLKAGAPFADSRVVIGGSGPLLLPVAAALANAGARLAIVAEQAPAWRVARFAASLWRTPTLLLQAAAYRRSFASVRYRTGAWVTRADGADRLERVTLTNGSASWDVSCDLLCTGFGLVPDTRLADLLGCTIAGGAVCVDPLQRTTVAGVWAAGEPTGIGGVGMSLLEGEVAGLAAVARLAEASAGARRVAAYRDAAARMAWAFAPRSELRSLLTPETIVCRCEDVPARTIPRDGGLRCARVHARLGMGACQGRVCGDAIAWLEGWEPEPARTPVVPVPLAALGSEPFSPEHPGA